MKSSSLIDKVILCLLIIFSIIFIFADIFHYQVIQKNKIFLENKIIYKKFNINHLLNFSKKIIFNFQSIFNNIDLNHELVTETNHLKDQINNLGRQIAFLKIESFLIKNNTSLYNDYLISSAKIIGNIKAKEFMILVDGPLDHIKTNDLIVNNCGILGKVIYVGNNAVLVMSTHNKKFNLPVSIATPDNKILGIYNGATNQISEINNKSNIFLNMEVFTMEQAHKIPCCILIGRVSKIDNENISIINSSSSCETDLALIISSK